MSGGLRVCGICSATESLRVAIEARITEKIEGHANVTFKQLAAETAFSKSCLHRHSRHMRRRLIEENRLSYFLPNDTWEVVWTDQVTADQYAEIERDAARRSTRRSRVWLVEVSHDRPPTYQTSKNPFALMDAEERAAYLAREAAPIIAEPGIIPT
jgi:hypothetical protein